jgi:hypothetical protein
MTFDLRLRADQLHLGRALNLLIEKFEDDGKGREIPAGKIWNALEDLRRHLEQLQLEGLGKINEASLMARTFAKLTGTPVDPRLPPTSDDLAYMKGFNAGMHALMKGVCDHVAAALIADAESTRKAQEKQEKRFATNAPGRSPM